MFGMFALLSRLGWLRRATSSSVSRRSRALRRRAKLSTCSMLQSSRVSTPLLSSPSLRRTTERFSNLTTCQRRRRRDNGPSGRIWSRQTCARRKHIRPGSDLDPTWIRPGLGVSWRYRYLDPTFPVSQSFSGTICLTQILTILSYLQTCHFRVGNWETGLHP